MHFRTFSDQASDGNRAAYALRPLLHSCYSVMTGTPHIQLLLSHAATIVLNQNLQPLLAIAQENMNLAGVGMPKGVCDRLATDLQYVIAGERVQRALQPLDDDVCPYARVACKFVGQLGE
jgi:hypothetical protein